MHPGPRMSRLWWFTAPVLSTLVLAALIIGSLRVPYVTLSPGGARSVEPLITITAKPGGPKVPDSKPSDDLLYLTVSTSVKPSGFVVLRGWLDDKVQVEPAAPFLGTQTSSENRKLNLALMTDSQDKARKVALELLGYHVKTTNIGAFLEDVDPAFPASSVLKPGMTVVGAAGKDVRSRDDLVHAITARHPGDRLSLDVVPLGQRAVRHVVAELGSRPEAPGVAVLGVSLVDKASYHFPVDIRIDTGQVGGPSAGLAFTLAILDRLTPGSLMGDQRVAVTGTIELDGTIGPVGGVTHKTEAAIREGAKLMIVPTDELADARKAAHGRIEVESATNLAQAISELEDVGGSGLPAPAG